MSCTVAFIPSFIDHLLI